MTTTYFTHSTSETAQNTAKNAARLNKKTALLTRETQGKNDTKQEIFYFISSESGNDIVFRTDKKVYLNMQLNLHYGLRYDEPTNKDGSPNITLVNLLSSVSQATEYIDTSLGLDWLKVAFVVYQVVEMKRINATETEIVKATIKDWIDAIQYNKQLMLADKIKVTEWLISKSSMGNLLDASQKKELAQLLQKLTDEETTKVTQPQTTTA